MQRTLWGALAVALLLLSGYPAAKLRGPGAAQGSLKD